jgi:hypothetical protein
MFGGANVWATRILVRRILGRVSSTRLALVVILTKFLLLYGSLAAILWGLRPNAGAFVGGVCAVLMGLAVHSWNDARMSESSLN